LVLIEGGTPATVAIVEAAEVWPDRCGEIGFDDRQTGLLEKMLRTRIDSLR
jgi:serine/threonine-protein kinase HipA